ELDGNVLILGGYRGSVLKTANSNKRLWVPMKATLNLVNYSLFLGLSDEDELHSEETVVATKMLSHFGPVDISKRLIKQLRASKNAKVHNYGYDWRLSVDLSARRLHNYLKKLYDEEEPDEHGRKKGTIVLAHSMGGIVAHGAMQIDPTLFRGLVYIGAPHDCVNALGPLKADDSVVMNKTILSAIANFSMRSSFSFLPLDGRCFIDRETGEPLPIDFFDPKNWQKYGLSPVVLSDAEKKVVKEALNKRQVLFPDLKKYPLTLMKSLLPDDAKFPSIGLLNTSVAQTTPDAYEYLERTLKRTKKFKESWAFKPEFADKYPPLAVVYSETTPTVRGCLVNGYEGIKTDSYSHLLYGPGDGVVHARKLLPPPGFNVVETVHTEHGHVQLMTDLPAIGKALKAILNNEK
ncbi:hypothetical protein CANCADRAFT_16553, partial [Tortispora caseinolytica NRRL Y-17796]